MVQVNEENLVKSLDPRTRYIHNLTRNILSNFKVKATMKESVMKAPRIRKSRDRNI